MNNYIHETKLNNKEHGLNKTELNAAILMESKGLGESIAYTSK